MQKNSLHATLEKLFIIIQSDLSANAKKAPDRFLMRLPSGFGSEKSLPTARYTLNNRIEIVSITVFIILRWCGRLSGGITKVRAEKKKS